AASQASALEVVPSGVMDFVFVYSNGPTVWDEPGNFTDSEFDRFSARQRSRIQIDFIANENLRGVMMLQFGRWEWGAGGAALDTTSDSALVRRLYIDFNFPDSPVNMKMGLMDLVLPYANFGQPVFGGHVAAVTATANVTDNASLTAFWARPSPSDAVKDNDMDVFGLWANLDFDSFTIAPWAAYASIGSDSGWFDREDINSGNFNETGAADWWGVGAAVKVMPTDALTVKFDAMYARLSGGDIEYNTEDIKASGYYFALAVDYALDWGTPGLFAIYSSGDDADDGDTNAEFHRIPGLQYSDYIYPTRMAFAGSMTCGYDSYISVSGIGLWMLGAQISNLSFAENVNHTARLAYIRGTNHIDSALIRGGTAPTLGSVVPLAYEDQAWEVGFDTYWQMYENLTVGLELGYIYLDATDKRDRDEIYNEDSVYSANLIFRFGF
ncbi:MAG: outer membrane homotrimeric porin, partial [Deltaproteobacteria bacterium]|nr:outer membrane homotrimeric porin [Deltaproteobacteria bacterium]